jgi:hypothetical protein
VREIKNFIESNRFFECLSKKFNLSIENCKTDVVIQKYLDGYEISPHPDIRKKALTFMINLNSDPESEQRAFHTHYVRFRPEYEYISKFWELNDRAERNWVPWDWCETKKLQRDNNSIVVFSPSFSSLHAVKASYDHLNFQRTQLYGNLWFDKDYLTPEWSPGWSDLLVGNSGIYATRSFINRLTLAVSKVAKFIKPRKLILMPLGETTIDFQCRGISWRYTT